MLCAVAARVRVYDPATVALRSPVRHSQRPFKRNAAPFLPPSLLLPVLVVVDDDGGVHIRCVAGKGSRGGSGFPPQSPEISAMPPTPSPASHMDSPAIGGGGGGNAMDVKDSSDDENYVSR